MTGMTGRSSRCVAGTCALLALGAAVTAAAGCGANEPVYFPAPGPLESGGGMGAATATVALSFRSPDDKEQARLDDESARLGQPAPWLRTSDVALSLLYTITNLDDRGGEAKLTIDGASEFAAYDAAALTAAAQAADDEAQEFLSLIRPTPVLLGPGEVRTGIVREDDFEEAALDLDAIARFGATPAAVLINTSTANPIGLEMIPVGHVRPALFRVQVNFSASRRMRLEFLLRVRDEHNHLARGADAPFEPNPAGYMPPAPPPP
jgi:hypothetical protein